MRPNHKILFVDDEPHVLSAVSRHLRREFEVVTACGAEAGMSALQNEGPFSVIVADMQMPGMDGIEFLQHAERLQPGAIRIMLTGNADVETRRRAESEASIARFLHKPCTPADLMHALQSALAA